jgi:hypothetical protein
MTKVIITFCLNDVRIDAGDILPPFFCVEDELPLALGSVLGPRHAGAIELVVDEGSAMDVPADLAKPLSGVVEAIYVTADVEVGLFLGHTVPVGAELAYDVLPNLRAIIIVVGLADQAPASITKPTGTHTIRRISKDNIELSCRCLPNPGEAIRLDKRVAVGTEGQAYFLPELDVAEPFLFTEVRFPRFVKGLRAFEVGGLCFEERGENDLSTSTLPSSGLR